MDFVYYIGLGVILSALALILYAIWQERKGHIWRAPDRKR